MGKLVFAIAGQSDAALIKKQEHAGMIIAVPTIERDFLTVENFRSFCDAVCIKIWFLDSGGFQLLGAEESARDNGTELSHELRSDPNAPIFDRHRDTPNLTSYHVVRYAREFEPDIVIGLDLPVVKTSDPRRQKMEFYTKFPRNLVWAIIMAKLMAKHCPKSQFFLTVQCYDVNQLRLFYGLVKKLPHDGVALPTRNMDVESLVGFLSLLHQLGVRRIHLLGVATFQIIAVAAYMTAKNYFDWISFDAKTPSEAARYSQYVNHWNLKLSSLANKRCVKKDRKPDCPCPGCVKKKSYKSIAGMEYGKKMVFLTLHNSYAIKEFSKLAYAEAKDFYKFRKFLLKRTPDKDLVNRIFLALLMFESRLRKRDHSTPKWPSKN